MCDFCAEFAREKAEKPRIVFERDGFIVLPTLGCFTDGYLLVVPREHVPSLASLPTASAAKAIQLAEEVREKLQETFGAFVLAEHGALDCEDTGAACCDHCHLHLIPMRGKSEAVLERYRSVGGPPESVSDARYFAERRGKSYVMLSVAAGRYQFWPATRFERQFVRKVCADLLGKGDRYNWREHHFAEIMWRTKQACDILLARSLQNVAA